MATKITHVAGGPHELYGHSLAGGHVEVPTELLVEGSFGHDQVLKLQLTTLKVLLRRRLIAVEVDGVAIGPAAPLAGELARFGKQRFGTDAGRPTNPGIGQEYFNTVSGKTETWSGTSWTVPAAGGDGEYVLRVCEYVVPAFDYSQAANLFPISPSYEAGAAIDDEESFLFEAASFSGAVPMIVVGDEVDDVIDRGASSSAGPSVQFTIHGTDIFGNEQSVVIATNGVGAYYATRAFRLPLTRFVSTANAQRKVQVFAGKGIAVSSPFVDGTVELSGLGDTMGITTVQSSHGASGTVIPSGYGLANFAGFSVRYDAIVRARV